jgi:hypothetical protein
MAMRTRAMVLFVAALLLTTADAQAAGRRRLLARQADQGHVESGYLDAGPIHRPVPADPRAIYPKYQGGFHSRALQNIGVPTGDIGIRGNGFMMNPW